VSEAEHEQRVRDARATLVHIDEQIDYYQAAVAKLYAA